MQNSNESIIWKTNDSAKYLLLWDKAQLYTVALHLKMANPCYNYYLLLHLAFLFLFMHFHLSMNNFQNSTMNVTHSQKKD